MYYRYFDIKLKHFWDNNDNDMVMDEYYLKVVSMHCCVCITILMLLIKWLIMVIVSKVSDTYTVYRTVYYIQVVM